MKTHKVFGMLIVTGNEDELKKVGKLAAGTHHLRGNPKPKPRAHRHVAQTTVVNEPVGGGSDDISASD